MEQPWFYQWKPQCSDILQRKKCSPLTFTFLLWQYLLEAVVDSWAGVLSDIWLFKVTQCAKSHGREIPPHMKNSHAYQLPSWLCFLSATVFCLPQWRQSNSLYNWWFWQHITESAELHRFCCSVPSSNQAHNPERKMTDIPKEGNGTLVPRELFCSIILQYRWITFIFFIS